MTNIHDVFLIYLHVQLIYKYTIMFLFRSGNVLTFFSSLQGVFCGL